MAQLEAPLILDHKEVTKPRTWFGYLPLWQECVPLDPLDRRIDGARLTANVMAGCIIGIRQTLSAIVSATLTFSTTKSGIVTDMFPFGISMMWYSTMLGSAFYGIFGRLQYNTNATQEVCSILYGAMASKAAIRLAAEPSQIPPTVLALIVVSTVLTGVVSLVLGKLGIGKFMRVFPTPVTSGFLGTIGFFLVKQALTLTSGVDFRYFYPVSLVDFCMPSSSIPLCCLFAMVAFMKKAPAILNDMFPNNKGLKKLSGLICQLLPLAFFYVVIFSLGETLDGLSKSGWTYGSQSSHNFWNLWTDYKLSDADWPTVAAIAPDMLSLVFMSLLCTNTGVLGIVGKFASGPDGDPSPDDMIDFDAEMTTVGMGAIITGITNGVVTFHRLGSSVQLRNDGGTHRVAVMSSAAFVGVFFFSSMPLGRFIPKFYLGGLFMSSGLDFLIGVFLSYRVLPRARSRVFGCQLPSPQYYVAIICVFVAAMSTPFAGIGAGLSLSLMLFLWQSAETPPVSSMSRGSTTMSRTLRPLWELRTLREEGDRIVILYLQGQLFFGSGQALAATITQAIEGEARLQYIVLSFAKVPYIDSTAVEQLKGAQQRARRRGVKVVGCRMNRDVFDALSAAQVICSPDADLRRIFDLSDSVEDTNSLVEHSISDEHGLGLGPSPRGLQVLRRVVTFRALGRGDYDAFDHETDALDFCSNQLLDKFCYVEGTKLEPYMLEFRTSCKKGLRLSEQVFEKMNHLPEATLETLRPHCQVRTDLSPGDLLPNVSDLYLVLQGAIAMVDRVPGRDAAKTDASRPDMDLPDVLHVGLKGFSGRGGKTRLRKRYPPGSVVGKTSFFLHRSGRMLDEQLMSDLVISSKFAVRTEVWVISSSAWDGLPAALQRVLLDLAVALQAEERQHTLLSGE